MFLRLIHVPSVAVPGDSFFGCLYPVSTLSLLRRLSFDFWAVLLFFCKITHARVSEYAQFILTIPKLFWIDLQMNFRRAKMDEKCAYFFRSRIDWLVKRRISRCIFQRYRRHACPTWLDWFVSNTRDRKEHLLLSMQLIFDSELYR